MFYVSYTTWLHKSQHLFWEIMAVFCHLQTFVTVNNYYVITNSNITWMIYKSVVLFCRYYHLQPVVFFTTTFWKEHRWNKSSDVLTRWTYFLFHWITHTLWSSNARNCKHGTGCMLETATFTGSYVIRALEQTRKSHKAPSGKLGFVCPLYFVPRSHMSIMGLSAAL